MKREYVGMDGQFSILTAMGKTTFERAEDFGDVNLELRKQ